MHVIQARTGTDSHTWTSACLDCFGGLDMDTPSGGLPSQEVNSVCRAGQPCVSVCAVLRVRVCVWWDDKVEAFSVNPFASAL